MYKFSLGKLVYTYIVGSFSVGIITPSRKKHIAKLGDIRGLVVERLNNGSADCRITASEVAAYVLDGKLL